MTEKNIIKKKPTISKSSSWRLLAQQTELPGFLPMGDEANQNHKLLANQQQVVQQPVVGDDELREWAKEFIQYDNHDKQKLLSMPVDQRMWTAPGINISNDQRGNQDLRDKLFGTTTPNQEPSYTAKMYAAQKAAELKRQEKKKMKENKVPILTKDIQTFTEEHTPMITNKVISDDIDTKWIHDFFDNQENEKKTGGSKRRRFRKSKKSKRRKSRITRRKRR